MNRRSMFSAAFLIGEKAVGPNEIGRNDNTAEDDGGD